MAGEEEGVSEGIMEQPWRILMAHFTDTIPGGLIMTLFITVAPLMVVMARRVK